jgi:hypothetical protein
MNARTVKKIDRMPIMHSRMRWQLSIRIRSPGRAIYVACCVIIPKFYLG